MTRNQTQILYTVIASVICYFIGGLAYKPLFLASGEMMENMSSQHLSLHGPVPSTDLALVRIMFGLIPILLSGCYYLIRDHVKYGLILTIGLFLVFITLLYPGQCFVEMFMIMDKAQSGRDMVKAELSSVRVGSMFRKSVLVSAVIVLLVNGILNRWYSYKKNVHVHS